MINERQETIADVVAKMLEFAETDSQTIGRDVLRRRIQNFARRFEAAAKREVAELKSKMNDVVCENEAMRDACGTCGAKREVAELREDSARLRAALKPVLEVYISQDDNSVSVYDGRLDAAFALNAVREAKRIYNEGEERIASPRNCDRPECATTKAAQDVWRKEDVGKTAYHEWLLTSTKGGAK